MSYFLVEPVRNRKRETGLQFHKTIMKRFSSKTTSSFPTKPRQKDIYRSLVVHSVNFIKV